MPFSSDALVFFGATGDLAYKKIFPSLQAMVKHGRLDVPVIGVAKAGWNLDQLKARARDSVEKHGGIDPAAFEKLLGLLRYVDGDYNDLATFQTLRKELGNARASGPLPGDSACDVRPGRRAIDEGRLHARCASDHRKAVWRDLASAIKLNCDFARKRSASETSSASITIWARRPFTTWCFSDLRIPFWNRFGIAIMSRACRSRWPRILACKAAARCMKRWARFATWCRTTCFKCCST